MCALAAAVALATTAVLRRVDGAGVAAVVVFV